MRKVGLTLFSVAACLGFGLMLAQPRTLAQTAPNESRERDRLVAALEQMRANHVDEPNEAALVTVAIQAMAGALGGEYFDAKAFRDLQISGRRLAWIGIEAVMDNGLFRVVTPLDDGPAARAGVRTNDIITHIDDVPLQGLTFTRTSLMLGGPFNTKVRLKIIRKGQDNPIELTVTRDFLRLRPVSTRQDGEDIGYIRIATFGEATGQLLPKAIAALSDQIPPDRLKGYVLDLRNNPGSMLEQAVAVADAFLDEGEIVSVRGRNPDQTQRFNAHPGDIINGMRLIVLINGGTASAAEVVAGALQDHGRATVIGTRSFGKGRVPDLLSLGSGNGVLRLLTRQYVTPAGRTIHGAGISPDIEVAEEPADNLAGDKALGLAYDLLRGIQTHAAFPPSPKAAAAPQ